MDTELPNPVRVPPRQPSAAEAPLLAAMSLGQPHLPRHRVGNFRHYLYTALIVVLCGVVGFVAHALTLTEANVIMIFLAGVTFAAARFGRGPAIFAAVFGVLVFDFFLVVPLLSFAASDAQYFVTFGVMLGYALLVSTLASRLHDQVYAAQQQAHRTAQLYRMTRELSSLSGPDSLAVMAGRLLREIFSGDVLVFFRGADGSLRLRVGEETKAAANPVNKLAARWVLENEETAGIGTDTYFDANALFVPMVGSFRTIGVLGVRPEDPQCFFDPEPRRMLETCASLIALSIERDQLFVEAQQAQVQVQSEQLRNSFLSAVSHDLRTPLATIAVSASSLLEDASEQSLAAKQEIVQTVVDESRRAARQVDNLLGMAQLHAGTITVHRDWEVLEELIGVSLARLRRELTGHAVQVRIGSDVPLLWVAGDLIELVLVNLLENAIRYTPAGTCIDISAERRGDRVEITLADNGPGLPAGSESKVFDKFFRGGTLVADGQRGIGLGLSICRALVQVHGGEIGAANGEAGGATFVISLPCPQESPQVTMDETSAADA